MKTQLKLGGCAVVCAISLAVVGCSVDTGAATSHPHEKIPTIKGGHMVGAQGTPPGVTMPNHK